MSATKSPLTILHTSDWHLGRSLYGRRRYEEFAAFLDWLCELIAQHRVDVLLLAGDVFDTSAPSNRAQQLYYRFLCRVAGASCARHVVVIGGNHDSPSFLDAPGELLRSLNVHVVGSATERAEDEVLVLADASGQPELLVCAVPYLRDRDIRSAQAGESLADKDRNLQRGIRDHYAAVVAHAVSVRKDLQADIPIVGMGHLFTAGGKTLDGDGVRDLYVGSLAHVAVDIFPPTLDYVALGHLHVPQIVAGSPFIRYSGSPVPMGFSEARQQKSVCLVKLGLPGGGDNSVQLLEVPVFRRLERIEGDLDALLARLRQLVVDQSQAWLELVYTGEAIVADLREILEDAIVGSDLEILRVKNTRLVERFLGQLQVDETLDEMDVDEVFRRCLQLHEIPPSQWSELERSFHETLASLQNADSRAE
jgi:exonuclease SbcD